MKYSNKSVSFDGSGYVVEIISATGASLGGKDTKVKLLPSGLMLKYAGEEDIYKPVRYSELSISAMMEGYNFDLYQPDLTSVTVNLYKQKNPKSNYKNLIWTGHLTPCVYSQPAYESKFEIEFVAVDCLSTLDGLTYEQDNKDIRSFDYIIKKCLNTADYYWWSDDCLNTESVPWLKLDEYFISEQNFYSSEGEPKTCKEVLESVLSYLNVTMVQEGHTFKIIDFDIQAGLTNNYCRKNDTANVFSGGNLSLSEVYSKIQITASTYQPDNFLPEIEEDDTVIKSNIYITDNQSIAYTKGYLWYWQMLRHNNNIMTYQINDSGMMSQKNDYKNEKALITTYGTTPIRWCDFEYEKTRKAYDWEYYYLMNNLRTTQEWSPVFLSVGGDFITTNLVAKNQPQISLKSYTPCCFINGYLCIGTEVFMQALGTPFPAELTGYDSKNIDKTLGYRNPRVQMRLKIGDKYLQADKSSWATTEAWFELEIGENEQAMQNNWLSLTDTVIDDIVDFTGFKVYVSEFLYGTATLDVRIPYIDTNSANSKAFMGSGYQPMYYFMKDVELKFIRAKDAGEIEIEKTLGDEEETDQIWETVIDDSFAAGAMELDLDVSTARTDVVSFSDVYTYYRTTGDGLNAVLLSRKMLLETVDKGLGDFPMEQYKLNSYYEHYSKPRKVLDITLDDVFKVGERVIIDGEHYIVNSSEIDILNDMSSVQLIQHDFLL
jgi:hypothetical protein